MRNQQDFLRRRASWQAYKSAYFCNNEKDHAIFCHVASAGRLQQVDEGTEEPQR